MTDHRDKEKLVKVLNLMGSNHDGEALSAARLAISLMEKFGLSWDRIIIRGKFDESKRYTQIRMQLWYLNSTVVPEMLHYRAIRNLERIFELNGDLTPVEHRELIRHFERMKSVVGMYLWRPHVPNKRLK